MTRRRLLASGGVAGAAAIVGVRPWNAEQAQAATDDYGVNAYLVRSSFVALDDHEFRLTGDGGSTTLRLEALSDIQGDNLAGSEDAFSLLFSTTTPVEQGVYRFSHVVLGEYDLFTSPVGGDGYYEVLVNRSVNAPKHYPKPPRSAATPGPAAGPDPDEPTPPAEPTPQRARERHAKRIKPSLHVKRIAARRLARGVVAEVALSPEADVKRVTVWLMRGDRSVAGDSVRDPHGRHVAVKLPMRHRLRGGRYILWVATVDRRGREQFTRKDLVLN